jgi:hypothetical protein
MIGKGRDGGMLSTTARIARPLMSTPPEAVITDLRPPHCNGMGGDLANRERNMRSYSAKKVGPMNEQASSLNPGSGCGQASSRSLTTSLCTRDAGSPSKYALTQAKASSWYTNIRDRPEFLNGGGRVQEAHCGRPTSQRVPVVTDAAVACDRASSTTF